MPSVKDYFEKNPGMLVIEPVRNGFNVKAYGPQILKQYDRHFDSHQDAFTYATDCAQDFGLMVGLQFKKRGTP